MFAGFAAAQSPPPHPRLMIRSTDLSALQARVAIAPVSSTLGQCATSVSWPLSSPSPSTQTGWTAMSAMRKMQEVAFHYALNGNLTCGNNAKAALLAACATLTPTGSASYVSSSYPAGLAITYDLVFPLLSAAERTTVINHLIAWCNAIKTGASPVAGYSSYTAAVDNYSFAFNTGLAMALMAIWGDTTAYPNLQTDLNQALAKLRAGWNDGVSPDGSIDESYGYSSYGCLYSIHAAVAAQNCGLGDYLAGTNMLKAGRWLVASLFGNSLVWTGDSSPSHKGTRLDTVLYYIVQRTQDQEAFWALERFMALDPASNYTPSQAFSPYLSKVLYYPLGLTAVRPEVASSFFRDNLNEGTPSGNKTSAYSGVGTGGMAFLHNSTNASETNFGAFYQIRDEWMNHSHEDDGHLSIASEGQFQFLDLGYSAQGGTWAGSQSTDHNIVVADGVTGFNGSGNNYYSPPSPNGRFLGRKEALLLSKGADYVRGSHENMWMMAEASRSTLMIKDPSSPYLILLDRVRKDTTSRNYDTLFHSASAASGAGTAASPMTVTANGKTLRSVFLSPSSVTVLPGTSTAANSGLTFFRNRVRTTGVSATLLSLHGKDAPASVQPLTGPSANTVGGTHVRGTFTDKILAARASGEIRDVATSSNARVAWLRFASGSVEEFVMGEGEILVHENTTLALTSVPVVLSARGGRVEVTQVYPGPLGQVGLVVRVPWSVSALTIDGQAVPFTQIEGTLRAGPAPVPPRSLTDRAYTFIEGDIGDADVTGNVIITPDERFTASSGSATLSLLGGAPVAVRPFAFGATVEFGTTLLSAASLLAGTTLNSEDLFRATISRPSPSQVTVTFGRGTALLGTAVIPVQPSHTGVRVSCHANPALGTIRVLDAAGVERASIVVGPWTAALYLRAQVQAGSFLDDITYFDSEENGTTPQGVVFWSSATTGRSAFVFHCPQFLDAEDTSLWYQNQRMDSQITIQWLIQSQMVETMATPHLQGLTVVPLGLREVGFESLGRAVPSIPGITIGASVTSPFGQDLYNDVNL